VLPILQALVESQPTGPGMPAPGGLLNAVSTLRPLLQPGSLILLLSDFAGLDAATEDLLASASLHSDCRLLWITDTLESSGLPSGSYRVGLPDRIWWMDGDQSRTSWQQSWQAREQQRERSGDAPESASQPPRHARPGYRKDDLIVAGTGMGGVTPDWLAQLAPEHAPPPPGWWPPAPGWWILLALSALIIAYIIFRQLNPTLRMKRAALRQLKNLESAAIDDIALARELEHLLRRYAVARFGRDLVAGLSGEKWICFHHRAWRKRMGRRHRNQPVARGLRRNGKRWTAP